MNGNKKGLFLAGFMAIFLVILLSTVTHLLFPQTDSGSRSAPSTAAAFFWTKEEIAEMPPSTHENQTLDHERVDWLQLRFEFSFEDGSSIGESEPYQREYSGEFIARELRRIYVQLFRLSIIDIPENTVLKTNKNTTISVALRAIDVFDLGVYECLNERRTTTTTSQGFETKVGLQNRSYTGFWKPNPLVDMEDWAIDIDRLSSMIQGNGTALITFEATINAEVEYGTSGEGTREMRGITLPPWEGRIGEIEIVYEQSRIVKIRYEFSRASLILLRLST